MAILPDLVYRQEHMWDHFNLRYDDMAAAVANILGVPYGSGATGVGNAYETDTQDQILRENYLPVQRYSLAFRLCCAVGNFLSIDV